MRPKQRTRAPSLAAALNAASDTKASEPQIAGKTSQPQASDASTSVPSAPTMLGPSTAASSSTKEKETTAPSSAAPLLLVIAVADERIATLLGSKIRAWLLPSAKDIEIRVIATTDMTDEEAKIASMLAKLGYKESAVKEAFGNVKLNW